MKQAYDSFCSMICDTNTIMALYDFVKEKIGPSLDCSDLLRWQWVQAVSTLDKYIHDIVRVGMIEVYIGCRQSTKKYLSFAITIDIHVKMKQDINSAVHILEKEIEFRNSHLSFQDPDNISDALSYIWPEEHKWQAIAAKMGLPEMNIKTKLKNISIRRNQIVHNGDYADSLLQRQTISRDDVIDVINFIENLGFCIFSLVSHNCKESAHARP